MSVETFGLTHTGLVRTNNEDALSIESELRVAIVADGMGGENSGEVASAITIETVASYLRNPREEGLQSSGLLKEAVRAANRSVWEAAQTRPECHGMGSTIVMARWCDGRVSIVNVGDSRAYLWRDGVLRQLSYDQNVGNDLRTALGLTEEQVRKYPHHNVLTMAVGVSPEVLIREHHEDLMVGDVIMLCSDGLYGPLGDSAIAATLARASSLPTMACELVEMANRAGGPDNITVALLRNYET
jgi:serine/threonine protein phosphatase PrpC